MTNYRIDLAYDGGDFHGWQTQPEQRTVQGTLQAALERLFRSPVAVEGAGRTDAGVHALAQVASFRHDRERAPEVVQRALGSLLPADVFVHRVRHVPEDFSARHSAVARRYRYRMRRGPQLFWRRYSFAVDAALRVEAMAEAAKSLVGEHDFTAFARSDVGTHCVCLVERATVTSAGPWIDFEITANRFVHNMVRRLAGVLLQVGLGRTTAAAVPAILAAQDRARGGPCLPPQALFLVEVRYPGDAALAPEGLAPFE